MLCVSTLCSICPYYTARALSKTADFVLMPYNYILSPRVCELCVCVRACVIFNIITNHEAGLSVSIFPLQLLEIHQIDLSNAILILDEAHNVVGTAPMTSLLMMSLNVF